MHGNWWVFASLVVRIISLWLLALLAMFWGPSTAIAGQTPYSLNPYVIFDRLTNCLVNRSCCLLLVCNHCSSLLLVVNVIISLFSISMRHPFLGEPTTMKDLIHTKWSDLFPGLILHYVFYYSYLGRTLLGSWYLWLLFRSTQDWICCCVY